MNIFLFILGFILSIIGLFFIILYFNLFVIGYNFIEFVYFIIRNIYCDLFFIGIILIIYTMKGKKK